MRKRAVKFGPETWAMVREAYLAGETATSLEKRLGPSEVSIRGRVHREGWTKKAHAEAMYRARYGPGLRAPSLPPNYAESGAAIPQSIPHPAAAPEESLAEAPLDPAALLREAATAARRAIAQGRPAEAVSLIKAAEGLAALARRIEEAERKAEAGPVPTAKEREAADLQIYQLIYGEAFKLAGEIGRELLPATARPGAPVSRFVYGWRAEHLDPRATQADFERAKYGGWWAHVFNADGTVKPCDFGDVARALGYDWPADSIVGAG